MYKQRLFILFILALSHVAYSQSADDLKAIYEDLSVFEDALATQLKKRTKKSKIRKIGHPVIRDVADQILRGEYETTYRVNTFQSYLSPRSEERRVGKVCSITVNP